MVKQTNLNISGCGKKAKSVYSKTIDHLGTYICNPNLNIKKCNWDGGDCCLNIINDILCPPLPSKACDCHEDKTRHVSYRNG